MKTHLTNGCWRSADNRNTTNVWNVDCAQCMSTDQYLDAKVEAQREKDERFMAQTPREIAEPWHQPYGSVLIVCRECGGNLFRIGDRSCHGHYQNYHCSQCAHVESRLTETGMSF